MQKLKKIFRQKQTGSRYERDLLPDFVLKDLPPPLGRLQEERALALWQDYKNYVKEQGGSDLGLASPKELKKQTRALHWVDFLKFRIDRGLQAAKDLEKIELEFNQRLARSATLSEKRRLTWDYCMRMQTDPNKLSGDRRALNRWLDTDAIVERFRKRKAELEYRMAFEWNRLGVAMQDMRWSSNELSDAGKTWRSFQLEKWVFLILYSKKDERLCAESIVAMKRTLQSFPEASRRGVVSPSTQTFFYRTALEGVWPLGVQMAAFDFLAVAARDAAVQVAKLRLNRLTDNDEMFMRAHCMQWLMGQDAALVFDDSRFVEQTGLNDNSPLVRQTFAEALADSDWSSADEALMKIIHEDQEPAVRAMAVLSISKRLGRQSTELDKQISWLDWMKIESDPFVLRTFLHGLERSVRIFFVRRDYTGASAFIDQMIGALDAHRIHWKSLEIRRQAARIIALLWMLKDTRRRLLLSGFKRLANSIPAGNCRLIPGRYLEKYTEEEIGRALCCLSQDDFSFTLRESPRGLYLWRGEKAQFRAWRFIHEFLNPAVDKRQSFEHTLGRDFPGRIHAPSGRLGELSRTKPPGEPYQIGTEGDWRPYLPLLDELVSCLQRVPRKTYRRYTPEGVVEIDAPKSVVTSLRASLKLNFQFSKISQIRDWAEGGESSPSGYIKTLERLGFRIRFRAYQDGGPQPLMDPAVLRFFPNPNPIAKPVATNIVPALAAVSLDWKGLYEEVKEYFYSAYGNSLLELTLFALGISGWLIGRQAWVSRKLNVARKSIPLVIGGWGTRGKSGTERLKAALFEFLGHGALSKSTGCEAMFMISFPYLKTREMFLYRPYDKATIWEQHGLIQLAAKMNSKVFLWECMGLTPAYVEILQRRWSRDDISTITNAYPDHEDIQGPAGKDVATVISGFIPENSQVVTTEENMLPILRESARKVNSRLMEVGWLEAGLLTPDILSRFPYQEHPFNIALVERMALELGMERNVALKEMADRVVADIGVLKTYPETKMNDRRFVFINGMSANERYGALGNWKRTGMDAPSWEDRPDEWIGAVVNNRADRIPRSRVFASILARDIHADLICLIGSNVSGLRGFIAGEWEGWTDQEVKIQDGQGLPLDEALNRWDMILRKMRLVYRPEVLQSRLRALLEPGFAQKGWGNEILNELMSSWESAEDLKDQLQSQAMGMREGYAAEVFGFHSRWLSQWKEISEFKGNLSSAGNDQSRASLWNEKGVELLTHFFNNKIVPVDQPQASGEEIQSVILKNTPPGFLGKLMGLQNIKGAGLNYVYAWQAWDDAYQAVGSMQKDTSEGIEAGLLRLTEFSEFESLCMEPVKQALQWVTERPYSQNEKVQALIRTVRLKLKKEQTSPELEKKENEDQPDFNETHWGRVISQLVGWLEGLMDPGDAVRRRKTANQVYKDLAEERISLARASEVLKKLISRQKGGWLMAKIFKK